MITKSYIGSFEDLSSLVNDMMNLKKAKLIIKIRHKNGSSFHV